MNQQDEHKLAILNQLMTHYGPQHWWEHENRLEDWVSMILVQQTTGINAEKAVANLAPYLTVTGLSELDMDELQRLIRPAGFYRQKSNYIKTLIAWYVAHGANLAAFKSTPTPDLRRELLAIKGVGAETADDMLLYIFERPVFIADTYARRLFNRLGFGPYQTYHQMQQEFDTLAAQQSFATCREWHAVIDEHGKAYRRDEALDESWIK